MTVITINPKVLTHSEEVEAAKQWVRDNEAKIKELGFSTHDLVEDVQPVAVSQPSPEKFKTFHVSYDEMGRVNTRYKNKYTDLIDICHEIAGELEETKVNSLVGIAEFIRSSVKKVDAMQAKVGTKSLALRRELMFYNIPVNMITFTEEGKPAVSESFGSLEFFTPNAVGDKAKFNREQAASQEQSRDKLRILRLDDAQGWRTEEMRRQFMAADQHAEEILSLFRVNMSSASWVTRIITAKQMMFENLEVIRTAGIQDEVNHKKNDDEDYGEYSGDVGYVKLPKELVSDFRAVQRRSNDYPTSWVAWGMPMRKNYYAQNMKFHDDCTAKSLMRDNGLDMKAWSKSESVRKEFYKLTHLIVDGNIPLSDLVV